MGHYRLPIFFTQISCNDDIRQSMHTSLRFYVRQIGGWIRISKPPLLIVVRGEKSPLI